ncbi:SPOR domain-containing protein [soil metagenome]
MAARRGKNQARRSGKRSGGVSGMTWLLAGLLIGGAAYGYLHFKERWEHPASNLPRPDPNAPVHSSGDDNGVAEVPDKPRVKYDFYELLPGREVVIPDAELDAQARAEQQAKIAAAAAAARAAAEGTTLAPVTGAASGQVATSPAPAGSATATSTDWAATPDNAATATTGQPAQPANGDKTSGPRYLIQAGAFRGIAEAEALKAKIAMTGEIARVETAQINGTTVHRVRMGPYPDASALAAAKQALASHGITAQAIRAK